MDAGRCSQCSPAVLHTRLLCSCRKGRLQRPGRAKSSHWVTDTKQKPQAAFFRKLSSILMRNELNGIKTETVPGGISNYTIDSSKNDSDTKGFLPLQVILSHRSKVTM